MGISIADPLLGTAGMADPDRQLESLGNWMMMEPSSPLFEYEPSRYLAGDGWSQDTTGTSTCSPSTGSKYAVGTNALFFTGVTFLWNASSDCTIFIGIDGQLEPIQASTGSVSLTASPQNHAIRLEASDCAEDSNGAKGTFQFFGIKFNTLDPSESKDSFTTVDDVDPVAQYIGFTSTPGGQGQIPDIQNGPFFQNTISYTSSAQAAATLTFTGRAIYVFGPTGPSFGTYRVMLDHTPVGMYNASSAVPTASTLLFSANQLDSSQNHQITLTNQVEGDALAVDYFVIATPDTGPFNPFGPGTQREAHGTDSTGILVGGLIGGLLAAILLFLAFMYWRYRRKGGKGNFWVAFCGPIRKALKVETKEDSQFRPWPMLLYRPKYAVKD